MSSSLMEIHPSKNATTAYAGKALLIESVLLQNVTSRWRRGNAM